MLAGHYAPAFLAKAASPRTPLWMLLLAAQFVDVLWVTAVLTGIEHARLDPSLPSNPLDLYHMPWTHSLLASLGWSIVAFFAATRVFGLATMQAALVAAVVTSHWFLDLLVHRPDLTLAGGSSKLGMGIWNYPAPAWALEVALVVAGVAVAMRACAHSDVSRRAWLWLGGGLLVLQTSASFGPIPPSLTAIALSTVAIYFMVIAAGAKVDAAARGSGS
ncbi:MAG: hypothetical protein ABR587_16100 [Candidatus Binatia bacterium]